MRYLVLSDIHANLPAFKAVLEAAKGQYDQVLFLGDLANFGPHPVECVELMKEHNAICIMGNHDEQIVAETQKQPWDRWAKEKLSGEQLQWLSEFKDSYIIDGHILVVHGVYTVNYDILPNTPDDDIKSAFKDILTPEIDEVWFGHYHYEINRIIDGVTYRCIRPVGHHRDKDIRASYSIFEGGEIKHYRISYDVDELINALKESDCFETEDGRDTFVDFVRNAFHEGLLKKDLAQLKLNDIRNLFDRIKDNPTACREEGKSLLFNKSSTLDERNYGIKFINRAFSLNDIEAMYVGSWYDDNYGFDGSAGAAFGAAIGVLIGFAILGAVLGGLVKMFKSRQADQIMQEYNEKAEEISHNATMMSSRFSNNERIQAIISKVTNKFSSAIQSANRPNYEKEISLSTKIIVSATEIQYADFERLNFKFERLAELTNVSERKSVAQVIAEGVAVRIKNQFTKDPSGTTPSVSVSYRNGTNEAIEAYVTYGCVNGNYKEITQW